MSDKLGSDRLSEQEANPEDTLEQIQRTVFIGGISLKSTPQDIIDYASLFDDVEYVLLPKSAKTRHLKGYAKVRFKTVDGASRIVSFSGHVIAGLNVGVSPWTTNEEYLKTKEILSSRKVYVKFKERLGVENVKNYFSKFGEIQQIDIKKHPLTGRFRDFGYIIFGSPEAAQQATADEIHFINNEKVKAQICRPNMYDARKVGLGPDTKEVSQLKFEEPKTNSFSAQNLIKSTASKKEGLVAVSGKTVDQTLTKLSKEGPSPLLTEGTTKTSIGKQSKNVNLSNVRQTLHHACFSQKSPMKPKDYCGKNLPQSSNRGNKPISSESNPYSLRPTCKKYFTYFRSVIQENHASSGNLQFIVYWPSVHRLTN